MTTHQGVQLFGTIIPKPNYTARILYKDDAKEVDIRKLEPEISEGIIAWIELVFKQLEDSLNQAINILDREITTGQEADQPCHEQLPLRTRNIMVPFGRSANQPIKQLTGAGIAARKRCIKDATNKITAIGPQKERLTFVLKDPSMISALDQEGITCLAGAIKTVIDDAVVSNWPEGDRSVKIYTLAVLRTLSDLANLRQADLSRGTGNDKSR